MGAGTEPPLVGCFRSWGWGRHCQKQGTARTRAFLRTALLGMRLGLVQEDSAGLRKNMFEGGRAMEQCPGRLWSLSPLILESKLWIQTPPGCIPV